MRKIFLLLLTLPMFLSSCTQDVDSKFDYDLDVLYGKWIVEKANDTDLTTSFVINKYGVTYAKFNKDFTYYGDGFFGKGNGTYTAIGKTITTYIDGKEFLKYDVISLNGNRCELKLYQTGSDASMILKCRKE